MCYDLTNLSDTKVAASAGAPVHYDPVAGVRHYACTLDCPVTQEAIDEVGARLKDCECLRLLIDEEGNSLIELWTDRKRCPSPGGVTSDVSLEVGEVTPSQLVDRFYVATRRNLESLFAAVVDLSLLNVVEVRRRAVVTLVDQFDLSLSLLDDDFDDAL